MNDEPKYIDDALSLAHNADAAAQVANNSQGAVDSGDSIPSYRAICFDLDGTLLPMDIDEFLSSYFNRIGPYVAARGFDGELFCKAVMVGTRAMAAARENDSRLNADVFWPEFARVYSADEETAKRIREVANAFYDDDFPHVGDNVVPNPAAARAIKTLRAKGYPLVLTTMPLFPLHAVRHRLEWAEVDPDAFARITHYENSRAAKPHLEYYRENLAALGLRGEDVLMVGNNTLEDLSFMQLGADAWLVTDWLLDPVEFDVSTVKNGSLEQFADWCESLPECANPATVIETGPVD